MSHQCDAWNTQVECHYCDSKMIAYPDTVTTDAIDDDGMFTVVETVSILMKCKRCGNCHYNSLK